MIKCVLPILIGVWLPPTKQEMVSMAVAQETCRRVYNSCAKVIEQREPRRWFVTCGE